MKKGRIQSLELLKATKFLSLYEAKYKNKFNEDKKWIIASRKDEATLSAQYNGEKEEKVDAVVILALHEEEKLVVIKQFRVPLNDYVYELPAGLVDGDEEPYAAVTRELKEETGLDLVQIYENKSNPKAYFSAGMTEESGALVYCSCKGSLSKDGLEADEDIEPMLLTKEDAKALLASDVKMDIKVFLVLQSFAQLGMDILK
ncbi:NUDIX hydrolase [Cellulosilyticum ruminicola]|uniref:NUDIX hydrolase n=1 Tax=Cellulosilyticum ruminicola TaxID=425254 RepID=UPI0006D0407D|nr:NUDIX hydrolase [Cellulosilyticum ruminicola]